MCDVAFLFFGAFVGIAIFLTLFGIHLWIVLRCRSHSE